MYDPFWEYLCIAGLVLAILVGLSILLNAVIDEGPDIRECGNFNGRYICLYPSQIIEQERPIEEAP